MKRFIYLSILISLIALSTLIIPQPTYAWIDQFNSSASVVIGQVDFTHNSLNQGGSPGANTLSYPKGTFVYGNKLFVVDSNNHRVLIYNSIPNSNNASANVVIGQSDFTHNSANQGGSVSASSLNSPKDVLVVSGRLIISDGANNRVLIFNTIPTSNNASADVVIGQADMIHNAANQGGSLAANTFSDNYGISVFGSKLFIGDQGNHRVLIYNSIPNSNNASANVVIGQSDFVSGLPNRGGSPAANTLSLPKGVYCDGQEVFIYDRWNYRVLIYNSIPTANNASADVVVGQIDFIHNLANQGGSVGANTLNAGSTSMGVFSDGQRLVIGDWGNARVLLFRSIPTSNNASADAVIGQVNFNSSQPNQGGSPGANTIAVATNIHIWSNRLFVTDDPNHRVLIYNLGPEHPLALINSGAPSVPGHHVTLTLSAEGAHEMMISNNSSFPGASWEPYATSKEWDLENGDSTKTVYVKYRDYAYFESDTVLALTDIPQTGKDFYWLKLPLIINNF